MVFLQIFQQAANCMIKVFYISKVLCLIFVFRIWQIFVNEVLW